MKIFLTGATGFIGRHLCRYLTENGHHVFALVRNPLKIARLPKNNLTIIEGDLNSFLNPDFKIPECHQIIHLAGTITANHAKQYEKDNFIAVKNLFKCLRKQKFKPEKLIFISSQAAAGPSSKSKPLTENDPPTPIDDYGKSKLAAEDFLQNQNEIPITIIRPPSVIGPLDTNVLNLFKVAKKGVGFVAGKTKQPISFIALDDLIVAIDILIKDKSNNHKTYFVAHDKPTSTHELWQLVAKSINKKIKIIPIPKPILYLSMKGMTGFSKLFNTHNVFDKKYYQQVSEEAWLCSSNKLKKDFNWKATQSLEEAIEKTAKSYKNAGWI